MVDGGRERPALVVGTTLEDSEEGMEAVGMLGQEPQPLVAVLRQTHQPCRCPLSRQVRAADAGVREFRLLDTPAMPWYYLVSGQGQRLYCSGAFKLMHCTVPRTSDGGMMQLARAREGRGAGSVVEHGT